MKKTLPILFAAVLVATAGYGMASTSVRSTASGVLAAVASSSDTTPTTPTPTTTTDTTPTTTATTPTRTLPEGAVVPKLAFARPKPSRALPGRVLCDDGGGTPGLTCHRYTLAHGKPVSWWYRVADSNGSLIYGISVFKGTVNFNKTVAGTGSIFIYHQKLIAKRWTWKSPARGSYRVCLIAIDDGPVRGGMSSVCQLVRVR